MIVLSVGMPRAGSGWYFNLVHDLMKTAGSVDTGKIREQYRLQKILTEVNYNIGVLSARRLSMLMIPALRGETFVVKAHAGPTVLSRLLQGFNLLRITYIYRDPRDAMLSAYEYGQRSLAKGRPNAFSHLTDFQKSLNFMVDYVRIWEKWVRQKGVLTARYEDLITRYDFESARLAKFLKIDVQSSEAQAVIEEYRPGKAEGQTGLHFYKGKIGRFRQEYSEEQCRTLTDIFGRQLEQMGYKF